VTGAQQQLAARVPELLDELRLEHGDVRVFSTPRRLAVFVESVSPQQPDREELAKGPPAERAFDKDGVATSAALGFARGKGVHVKDLQVREMDGGRYVIAVVKQKGRPAAESLADALPKLVESLKFEKSIRWNSTGVFFSRPIRWLVALFGETVIPFEYAGVSAGDVTRGLRPYGSPEIKVPSASKYFDIIREAGIVLDGDERRASIAHQIGQAAAAARGEAIVDEALLAEVTNLVERPTAVLGSFNPEFLALPHDVLISTMKKHQRYFPVTHPKSHALLPSFIAIRNGDSEGIDLVRQGNEHVLGARFADADFFVREDLKHTLEDFRPRLSGLIFQTKLGSMLDKSERLLGLVDGVASLLELDEAQTLAARRAAYLAKADLLTHMVTEMTSLQGIIGREYALRSGENPDVAAAIGEQYQPVPETRVGLALALADRLDSLTGLFAAGLAPTGTKDPFGLRRTAIGVVQPLIEHDLDFDLRVAVEESAATQPIPVSKETRAQVLEFIAGRLRVVLMDLGHKYDVVDAILAFQSDNPARAARAVAQLQAWVGREDWNVVLPAFARCVRITRDQKKKYAVRPDAFTEDAERGLYEAVQSSAARGPTSVDELLTCVVSLIPAINTFFDQVLVMAEDKAIRENRLGLVQAIARLADGIADLSKLEGF
jgi:glycyl-tRNA synthetase